MGAQATLLRIDHHGTTVKCWRVVVVVREICPAASWMPRHEQRADKHVTRGPAIRKPVSGHRYRLSAMNPWSIPLLERHRPGSEVLSMKDMTVPQNLLLKLPQNRTCTDAPLSTRPDFDGRARVGSYQLARKIWLHPKTCFSKHKFTPAHRKMSPISIWPNCNWQIVARPDRLLPNHPNGKSYLYDCSKHIEILIPYRYSAPQVKVCAHKSQTTQIDFAPSAGKLAYNTCLLTDMC